jgi:hypothetical protein
MHSGIPPAVTRPRRFGPASAWSKAVASANEPDRSYLRRDLDLERRDRHRVPKWDFEEEQPMPAVLARGRAWVEIVVACGHAARRLCQSSPKRTVGHSNTS